jgi:hypothetical protein
MTRITTPEVLAALLDRAPDASAERKVGPSHQSSSIMHVFLQKATFPGSGVAVGTRT